MLPISERRACTALGQHRSTQRKLPRDRDDEEQLTAELIELARQYGRNGYRKVAELLRRDRLHHAGQPMGERLHRRT